MDAEDEDSKPKKIPRRSAAEANQRMEEHAELVRLRAENERLKQDNFRLEIACQQLRDAAKQGGK